jgi:hypothetical protein
MMRYPHTDFVIDRRPRRRTKNGTMAEWAWGAVLFTAAIFCAWMGAGE